MPSQSAYPQNAYQALRSNLQSLSEYDYKIPSPSGQASLFCFLQGALHGLSSLARKMFSQNYPPHRQQPPRPLAPPAN